MQTHFSNPRIAPVTAEQLQSVGIDPTELWFSPTFRSWVFCGATCQRFPYRTTGGILASLGLTPDPEA